MSKHFKPGRARVALKPSRIRREPVRLEAPVDPVKAEARARERDMWGGVAGVLLFALALTVLVVGISAATIIHYDAAAEAGAKRFGQCYNAEGPNCVLDGGTIFVGGKKVAIAGVDAPAIDDARCEAERNRGIDAAVRLVDLLNSGNVTVSAPLRDASGRVVRKVAVDGDNVAATMIDAGAVREPGSDTPTWC